MAATVPTAAEVITYLAAQGTSPDSTKVTSALAAETAAQAAVCRVDPYTADLREALMRRTHRNLAMRSLPLGVQASELGTTRLGSNDPEVRRLERPYRKLPVG
jgi:hypothetical protein